MKYPEKPGFSKCKDQTLHLARPVLLTDQKVLKSHTLYIAKADSIPSTLQYEKHSALITIGMPDDHIIQKTDNLIVYKESADLLDLFNQISRVYDFFDDWEKKLLSIPFRSLTKNMYQQALDISDDVFENGISLMNNTFSIVFENETNLQYAGYNRTGSEQDFAMPADIINFFKYDKEYQKIVNEREVFYYDGDILPHRVLCKNIFLNETFLFRIILTECIRPFRKSDELLLEYLSGCFVRFLQQSLLQNPTSGDGLSRLLTESIETGKSNRKALESELQKLSWRTNHIYRIASVHASSGDLVISSLIYFSHEIMHSFPGSYAFQYQDQIIMLINETRAGSIETYSNDLSVFVRENNFRVGISNFADDVFAIQTMYRQAEIALMIGQSEKPMEWIHRFSNYTLQYIFNLLTCNSDLGQLYSPVYYRLERYDKENGTFYLETLRVYLKCRMNTVQAAKELFIQRSTMIYRLKRIREIADNDLEDSDDLLHLYLTFSIIEREEKQKEH